MARRRQAPAAHRRASRARSGPLAAGALLALLIAFVLPSGASAQAAAPDEASLPSSPSKATVRATSASTGGVSADGARGGVEDPQRSGAIAYGAPAPRRPIARVFRAAPATITAGDVLRLRVQVDEPGVRRVRARVVVVGEGGRVGARFSLGKLRTNKLVSVRRRLKLPAGAWVLRLHVKDPEGETLARAASTTGKANLLVKVRPRPRPENSQPEPPADPNPPAPVGGGTFPVAGAHSYGGDDSRFGAGRPGHIHQGQDISAAEGTPVVSPLPGTVSFVDFQAKGAGYYVVIQTDDGRALFFAHLQKGSITVQPGQRVAEATTIGRVGSTGASSGPHLHFEIWIGGWRDKKGTSPIDPLPQLREWDR